MLSPTCPLTKKEKLYVILHHECNKYLNLKCLTECTFYTPTTTTAKWTVELKNDLKSFHNLDVEKELVAIMAEEIRREIDREFLKKC